jgi:hypothetical protein
MVEKVTEWNLITTDLDGTNYYVDEASVVFQNQTATFWLKIVPPRESETLHATRNLLELYAKRNDSVEYTRQRWLIDKSRSVAQLLQLFAYDHWGVFLASISFSELTDTPIEPMSVEEKIAKHVYDCAGLRNRESASEATESNLQSQKKDVPPPVLAAWLYHASLESSEWQATLGKKAVGLAVTDCNGAGISFGKATGRHFGHLISALTLTMGYLMVAFTEKKQALHDIMAGTAIEPRLSRTVRGWIIGCAGVVICTVLAGLFVVGNPHSQRGAGGGSAKAEVQELFYAVRGDANLRAGRYAKAVEDFSHAIDLSPRKDLVDVHFLGAYYYKRGLAHKQVGNDAQYVADLKQAGNYGNEDAKKHMETLFMWKVAEP